VQLQAAHADVLLDADRQAVQGAGGPAAAGGEASIEVARLREAGRGQELGEAVGLDRVSL
jgi:hypothetical protein